MTPTNQEQDSKFRDLQDSKPGKTLILRWARPVSNPERLDFGWVIFRFSQACTRPKVLAVSYFFNVIFWPAFIWRFSLRRKIQTNKSWGFLLRQLCKCQLFRQVFNCWLQIFTLFLWVSRFFFKTISYIGIFVLFWF